jgi:hypothetical protein
MIDLEKQLAAVADQIGPNQKKVAISRAEKDGAWAQTKLKHQDFV